MFSVSLFLPLLSSSLPPYTFPSNFLCFSLTLSLLPLLRDGISQLSYRLLRYCPDEGGQSLVTLGLQGVVRTAGFNGHAVVMVTAHEPELGLNQSTIVHLEVSQLTVL